MKKLLLLIIVSLVLAGIANAATVWNPAANNPPVIPPAVGNWNDAGNWTNGVPVSAAPGETKVVFNVDGAADCIVTDDQMYGGNLVQGDNSPGGVLRIMDGATLTGVGAVWMAVGFNNTAKLIVERGAVYDHAGHFWWGMHAGADSVVEINGGTVYGGQSFGLGEWFGGEGDHGQCKVYINDGELNVDHWSGAIDSEHPVFWNDSFIDISFGKMVINNNSEAAAQAYIDAGKITGFGEVGNAQVVYADGVTTITATADPLDRSPEMDAWDVPRPVTLSWNNIDSIPSSGPVWVEVWFGTDPTYGQNESDPNIWEYTDFTRIVDVEQDLTSVPVSTLTDSTEGFFWQVNTYVHGDPAHGQYNYGDDPNLDGEDIVKGLLMNFHTPNGPSCAGLADFNCSGVIALDDLSYIAGVWLTDDPLADIADPADNMVDVLDLSVVAQQWLDVSAEIAYWMFDETEGSVASDSSANDFEGTLVNMDDTDWVPGLAGNALDFDGLDDYVDVGNVFAELVGRDLTISAWVKAPALNPAMQFMISINTANGDDNKLLCGTRKNTPTLSLADSVPAWRDTTATVIDNTWHHIAIVLDDSANIITVYVDGSFATNFTSMISLAAGDILSFGQEYDPGMVTGDFYSGQLDDVRVYDRVLSEAEIAVLAQ